MVCVLGIVGINFGGQRKYRESGGDSEGGGVTIPPLKIHVDVMGRGIRTAGILVRRNSAGESLWRRAPTVAGASRPSPFAAELRIGERRCFARRESFAGPASPLSIAMDIAGKRWHQRR
jgi:hypothetical protein